jgi:hypothetical protein
MRGGIETIYDDLPKRIGLAAFAPVGGRGVMFSASSRIGRDEVANSAVQDAELR